MKRISHLLYLSIFVSILVSCNNGKDEWIKAKSENTVEALENFVKAFPKSAYTELANKSIDSIYHFMDLFPVFVNNKFGFIDDKGQLRIKYRFIDALDFSGDFALVKDSLKWGIINKKGEYIIKPEYDEISEYSEGLSAVKKNNKWGFMDTTGMLTINYMFDDVWFFSDSLALVEKDNKWGFINRSGSFVIRPNYQQSYIKENCVMTYVYNSGGFLKKILSCENGKKIIKKEFEYLERQPDYLGNYIWNYTEKKNDHPSDATTTECIDEFENGIARIFVNGKWGFVNMEGKMVIRPEYDYCTTFENNIAIIQKDGLFGYIDITGKIVLPPRYLIASTFSEDYAVVQIENSDRITFINKAGKPMTNLKIQSSTSFKNGLAGALINNKWGFIDNNFNLTIQPQFDEVESFHNNLALVKIKDKWGIINRKGNIVIDCKYDRLEFKGEVLSVSENNIEAYIDTNGNYIWKTELNK